MRIPAPLLPFGVGAAVCIACSRAPQPAATAPVSANAAAAAPAVGTFLVGDWAVRYTEQGSTTTGTMRITLTGNGYGGILQLDTASQPYRIRSATVDNEHFVIRLSTTDGDATIEGNRRTPTELEALYNGQHNQGRLIADRR